METPAQLIRQFYTAFQQKDYKSMQSCYAESAVFNDPVFVNLNASEVKNMWEMLIKKGQDMELEFSEIIGKGDVVKAKWEAKYTFSLTGRKVLNRIDATFVIKDGKIVSHTDRFDFYKWSKQAFGLKGALLGWTDFFKEKVRNSARTNLENFIASN